MVDGHGVGQPAGWSVFGTGERAGRGLACALYRMKFPVVLPFQCFGIWLGFVT